MLWELPTILRNKHVTLDTKRALYETIFLPTLCYQRQACTLTAAVKRKIVTTEMNVLRRKLNVSRLDKIKNEIIRQRTGTTPVLDYTKHGDLLTM
jgi:hypothetical protein